MGNRNRQVWNEENFKTTVVRKFPIKITLPSSPRHLTLGWPVDFVVVVASIVYGSCSFFTVYTQQQCWARVERKYTHNFPAQVGFPTSLRPTTLLFCFSSCSSSLLLSSILRTLALFLYEIESEAKECRSVAHTHALLVYAKKSCHK